MQVNDPSAVRSRLGRLARLTVCGAATLVSSGVIAAQASAATLVVPAPCVVNPSAFNGAPMIVDGSGFTPGDSVELTTNKGDGFGNTTADANGAFTVTMTAPVLAKSAPGEATFILTAADQTDGVTTATASFLAANLAVAANPPRAKLGKKVTFSFSGFTDGASIYGHYLHRKRVVTTERMGRATGPCGLLKTRAALFPKHARYQDYSIQYDDSAHYSKASVPSLIATLTTVSF